MNLLALSSGLGNSLILLFVVGIPCYGFCRKVPVYEVFVEGAREGFPIFLRIMPAMLAMLVAIGMLRASGAFDLLAKVLAPQFAHLGIPVEVVPVAMIRPFSGSGASAALADVLRAQGGNTFAAHLAAIIASTTETTFYVVSIYFGAANIRDSRYAIPASLLVDLAGLCSAVWFATRLL